MCTSFHSAPFLHDAVLLAIIFAVVVLISVCTAGVGGLNKQSKKPVWGENVGEIQVFRNKIRCTFLTSPPAVHNQTLLPAS